MWPSATPTQSWAWGLRRGRHPLHTCVLGVLSSALGLGPKSTVSLKAGVSAGRVVNGLLVEPELWSRPARHRTRVQARCALPGPVGHTHSLWFKSTLLLFLRLLLSTKKRWPAKPFFFLLLLPGKTGHREWYITDLQTWRERSERTATAWLCEELTVLLLRPGSVSFPSEMFGFPLPRAPGAPPGARLSQIGRGRGRGRAPGRRQAAARGARPSQSPPAVAAFPPQRSVAWSSNKLVAVKADAVFS